eukprot:TRINITY_DN121712_c0_g1_i1.p1 TRINITY_DN121712_c0_g1~~TRINITY_DN121712_c0_g1_i1.p1  ORF type:complete len:601 (+),score=156.05 TRINITY_DN121712_c0_g1_i1:112-1914(+)
MAPVEACVAKTQECMQNLKSWRGMSGAPLDEDDQLLKVLKETNGNLREAVGKLLEMGGDERSVVNPKTGLTKYNTVAVPCPGAIVRSSCTSNVPFEEGFQRGIDTLRQLVLEAKRLARNAQAGKQQSAPEDLFRKLLCDVRERVRGVFELTDEDAITLFPSGTDAELLPLLVAVARALTNSKEREPNVFNVVTASGEVGSGTFQASVGKHFAARLPSGQAKTDVKDGVFDLPGGFLCEGKALAMRTDDGTLLAKEVLDKQVEDTVAEALARQEESGRPKYGCVVVHIVLGSKTAQSMPSEACIERLSEKYGDLVIPVVDGCQGRLKQSAVRDHLEKKRCVLSTGSKFYGGPPFAGVCLLPPGLAAELEGHLAVSKDLQEMVKESRLCAYVGSSLVSDDLPQLKSLLPARPLNYGTLMRWTVALHGMEAYFAEMTVSDRIATLSGWSNGVREVIREKNCPLITLLHDEACTKLADDEESEACLSTIVSFHCLCNRGTPDQSADPMTVDELRKVQNLLATDMSKAFPHMMLLDATKQRCFIGQPVDLTLTGSKGPTSNVLRVAASAPMIVRTWNVGVEKTLEEDRAIFDKLEIILNNWFLFN